MTTPFASAANAPDQQHSARHSRCDLRAQLSKPLLDAKLTTTAFVMAALLVFGALLVTAVNGMVFIDRNGAVHSTRSGTTSRLPFVAIVTGTRFELAEFHVLQATLSVVLFSGVFWLRGIAGPSPLCAVHI